MRPLLLCTNTKKPARDTSRFYIFESSELQHSINSSFYPPTNLSDNYRGNHYSSAERSIAVFHVAYWQLHRFGLWRQNDYAWEIESGKLVQALSSVRKLFIYKFRSISILCQLEYISRKPINNKISGKKKERRKGLSFLKESNKVFKIIKQFIVLAVCWQRIFHLQLFPKDRCLYFL